MNNTPLITIGITCYNAQDTIVRAIESALRQTWEHTEIIIVDDCSTDGSLKVIEKYIENNNATLVQHEKNGGPAAARQTIIENSKGEFIAFFDDDDESLPARLKKQYERIVSYEQETEEKLISCHASGKRLYDNGYDLPLKAIGSQSIIPFGKSVADRLLFFGGNKDFFFGSGTPTCSLMARRDVFEMIGGFDADLRRVEDVDFAIRLALAGGNFIGCSDVLFIQHATDGGDKAPEKNRDAEIALAEKHKNYLCSVGRYYYAKTWPLLRYYHFKGNYARMVTTLVFLFVRHPVKTTCHFMTTVPKRFLHELKIKKGT